MPLIYTLKLNIPELFYAPSNMGKLMESLSSTGMPFGLPAMDKHHMLTSLRAWSAKNGLPSEYVDKLVDKFKVGYKGVCPNLTPESEAFAALFYELSMLDSAKPGSIVFETLLARINTKFEAPLKSAGVDALKEISNKHIKTFEAIFAQPRLSNIIWSDIEALLRHLGAEITEAEGSRVHISLNGIAATFHRPHERKETDKGAVASMRHFLERAWISNSRLVK